MACTPHFPDGSCLQIDFDISTFSRAMSDVSLFYCEMYSLFEESIPHFLR